MLLERFGSEKCSKIYLDCFYHIAAFVKMMYLSTVHSVWHASLSERKAL